MKIFLIVIGLLAVLCIAMGVFALFIPACFLLFVLWAISKVSAFSSTLRGAGRRHARTRNSP